MCMNVVCAFLNKKLQNVTLLNISIHFYVEIDFSRNYLAPFCSLLLTLLPNSSTFIYILCIENVLKCNVHSQSFFTHNFPCEMSRSSYGVVNRCQSKMLELLTSTTIDSIEEEKKLKYFARYFILVLGVI